MTDTQSFPETHLTVGAVDQLRQRGWVHVPGYLSVAQLSDLRAEAQAAASDAPANPACAYFYDRLGAGPDRLARIEGLAAALPSVLSGPIGRRMQQDAARCLDAPVQPFKEKLNLRYPGSPGYAPHQDAARWDRHGSRFLSFGLFLAPSDAERGGFEMVTQGGPWGRLQNDRGDLDEAAYLALPRVEVKARPGDALILDGDVPHRTTDNRSGDTILHVLFTYVSGAAPGARDRYYADQRQDFEPVRHGPNVYVFGPRR